MQFNGSGARTNHIGFTPCIEQQYGERPMTLSKILIAAALLSMTAVTSASAQLPAWGNSNPDLFESQYPDRDVLNGGALAPAGRMGLELPDGAAPDFGASNAYAATAHTAASSCAQLYHSYDPASGTFLAYDGRRHTCE
jgi:BA14K-like protein